MDSFYLPFFDNNSCMLQPATIKNILIHCAAVKPTTETFVLKSKNEVNV